MATGTDLHDLHARVVRLVEALEDHDLEFLRIGLDGLEADLWKAIADEPPANLRSIRG